MKQGLISLGGGFPRMTNIKMLECPLKEAYNCDCKLLTVGIVIFLFISSKNITFADRIII